MKQKDIIETKEGREMTVCLYKCLRSVGLHHHYARFILMGICRTVHLSTLSMEDYPLLGVHSMEDRTRLFHLVQLIKTLDLKSLPHDNGNDEDYDEGDEGLAVLHGSFSPNGYINPQDDLIGDGDVGAAMGSSDASTFARPSNVRRRLSFSDKTLDHHQRLFSYPAGTHHDYANSKVNDEPVHEKATATPVQLEHKRRRAAACGHQGSNNYKQDVQSFLCDLNNGENTMETDVTGESSKSLSDALFTSNLKKLPKQKPSPAKMKGKTLNSKPFGHKDRRKMSWKKICYTDTPVPTPVYEVKTTAGYNYGVPLTSSPALKNKRLGGPRISVCVRKRPLTCAECRRGETNVVKTPGGECIIVHESKETVDLAHYILEHRFYFDQVFGEECSNEEVYQRTAYPLVQHMLNGGKATCFAYGQTGAGKTHTMLGSSPGRPGLYILAARDIFTHLSTMHTYASLLVYVSFFEIYCGQLYDLLNHRERLFAREDGQKVVHISGLQNVRVDSIGSLLQVISHGTAERTQGISGVNPLSSRSHALLQIQLRDPNQKIAGRLWFVDLAGSERASDAKEPHRQSRMEGAEINQSLLALKECIRSLDKKSSHTPFRQSKLTQVLKDSFVGNSLTCMIANISPGHPSTEHTLNTLRYADRVKELKGKRGPRGRGKSETVPSPKQNMSTSNSTDSVATPEKQNLGNRSEGLGPNTPTTKLNMNNTLLCSTPKNNKCGEETQARDSKGFTLEYTTPVRGWLGMGDKIYPCKGNYERDRGELVNEKYGSIYRHNVREKSTRAAGTGQRGGEVSQTCTERQVESRRDTSREITRENESNLNRPDDKEKERHLKWYHQQLQKFAPSLTPSLVQLFSSSHQSSLCSLQQSSCLSVSAHLYCDLEEISDAYTARATVKVGCNNGQTPSSCGETNEQNETSTKCSNGDNEDIHSDCLDANEEWRVPLEGTRAGFGQDKYECIKRSFIEAVVKEREMREERKPAEMEKGGDRCARMAAERVSTGRMMGAIPTNIKTQVSNSSESEDRREEGVKALDASDILDNGVWSTPQRGAADSYSLESAHCLFSDFPLELSHQQAPAESPISPSCEHTKAHQSAEQQKAFPESQYTRRNSEILILQMENTPKAVLSNIQRKKKPHVSAYDNKTPFSPVQSSPVTVTTTATSSFLQKDGSSSISCCLLKSDRGEDKRGNVGNKCFSCVDKGAKIPLSPMESPQVKLSQPSRSGSVTAINHTEQQKLARSDVCGTGTNKHHISGFTLTSLKDQESNQGRQIPLVHNKRATASLLKPSTSASTETPVISLSVQHFGNACTPSFCNPPEHACNADKKTPSSITTQQSESFPGQFLPVHSSHSVNSCVSHKSNSPAVLSDQDISHNQHAGPTVHMYTLDNTEYAKWSIVEAHLEQLKEMEALCHKEGMLLSQRHDMAFEDYVHKLEDIMKRKARCVFSMRTQLQPYLKLIQSNHH